MGLFPQLLLNVRAKSEWLEGSPVAEGSPALLSPASVDGVAGMEADIELIALSSSLCTRPTGELLADQ